MHDLVARLGVVAVLGVLGPLALGCGKDGPRKDPHFTGVVSDATSGAGIAGVTVEVTTEECVADIGGLCVDTEFVTHATATSGADGAFQLDVPLDFVCAGIRTHHLDYVVDVPPTMPCDGDGNTMNQLAIELERRAPGQAAFTVDPGIPVVIGFSSQDGLLVTRRPTGTAAEPPVDEQTYEVGDTLGGATVVCMVPREACPQPPTGPCTCEDATAVAGTAYTYSGYFATGIPLYGAELAVEHTP